MQIKSEMYIKIEYTPDDEFSPSELLDKMPDVSSCNPDEKIGIWDSYTDEVYKSLLFDFIEDPDKLGNDIRSTIVQSVKDKTIKMPESQLSMQRENGFEDANYYIQKYGKNVYKKFEDYVERLLPESEDLLAFDPKVIEELDTSIRQGNDKDLEKVRTMLGSLVHEYTLRIDNLMDPIKIEELRFDVIDKLNKYEGHDRKTPLIAINGQVLAGKGTTMKKLGLDAVVETGTEGIMGAGKQHEHWETFSKLTKFPRGNGLIIPNNLTGTSVCLELINRRNKLDKERRQDNPIVLSGFPRTEKQAHWLDGVENMKAVYLDMSAKENAERTVRRLVEFASVDLANGNTDFPSIRGDDLESITLKKGGKELTASELLAEISEPLSKLSLDEFDNIGKLGIFEFGEKQIHSLDDIQKIYNSAELKPHARWHTYNKTKQQISDALAKIGVEQKVISVDGKMPNQVAEEVKQILEL